MYRHDCKISVKWIFDFPLGRIKPDIVTYLLLIFCVINCVGCGSLRFTPSEKQKQNAWLHNCTANIIVDEARQQQVTQQLQALTELSELQSRAFMTYYGLPENIIEADTAEEILKQSNYELADEALSESSTRPRSWEIADSVLELGIGICALFGGIYGAKAARYLKEAKVKSQALKEIITGNELFKKKNSDIVAAFKKAQAVQSSKTREIVAAMKG